MKKRRALLDFLYVDCARDSPQCFSFDRPFFIFELKSKLESGNVDIIMKESNLQESLSAVVHSIESRSKTKRLTVKTIYDHGTYHLNGGNSYFL